MSKSEKITLLFAGLSILIAIIELLMK